jgi:hypothetical protein
MEEGFVFIKEGYYSKRRKSGKLDYFEKKCCKNCEEEFFKRKYKKNNIYCSSECRKIGSESPKLIFNKNDYSVLVGSILSDGCITKTQNTKNYYFTHLCKYEEYVDFISSELSFDLSKYASERKGKNYYTIRSGVNESFTELRDKWYPDGKKQVPLDLKLNDVVMLHWFLGDGNLDNKNGITFCTDSFNKEGVDFLIDEIKKLGFDSYYSNKNRIIIPNRCVYEFLEFIGPTPVECYLHKWDSIVKESYIGRICKNPKCDNVFDAKVNHNYYCSKNCCNQVWRLKNK